ncbi:ABC transporter ATP-binding protein [Mycoplasmopsis californica HAZ160_1]|uniref:ABC transporter ATP-binding protein n=1 Tax=Mycoplasmopsis californica HAZ160_1 TaxID=1397850 RepID=A0AAT9F9E4_9BACT|nr:ABC transporter ATP-binding protein [Mycoplasmopsis californica]BAP01324.1 ABC transporter ATP-binding protein [Mycoplasmopsis californica HAZ160_1]BBG41197.1 ABC transporter ATP-binding protein [Mycoplasmopsis californica]BBG41790.1 ABC transporter ATP-binding protein [Mycoplasmopsis californica]BBG42384.1 ABC transporter ATP-binding protein [Mycoplasmopsis californica]BBG42959.1 ABC transporter ATP-binding protein [Mycoplasmopsis californica]
MSKKTEKRLKKLKDSNLSVEEKSLITLQSQTSEYVVETKVNKNNIFDVIDASGSARNIIAPRSVCSYIKRIASKKRRKDGGELAKNSGDNIIEVKNVSKYYVTGQTITKVLSHIDIEIKQGEMVLILGVSGGGKSTLLNLISGLDRPTLGDVIVDNMNFPYYSDRALTKFRRDKVSFIFQNYNLLENLNAFDNVMTGVWLQKDKKRRLNLEELFNRYEMAEEINKFPPQMSGGQQQRVSIMRALAKNAPIIFADEPTGALDEKTTRIVLNSLYKANREWNTTVVMVSHNPAMSAMCHRIINIDKGIIKSVEINKNPLHPDQIGLYNE